MTNKGILIINEPLTCAHCKFTFSYQNGEYKTVWACILTGKDVSIEEKDDSCPIIGINEPIERLVYGISDRR